MATTKKKSTRRGAARRNPPKGFSSWKAYMASIRPGAKKRTRSNPAGGSPVAAKRKRRKATHGAARRNPPRAHAATTTRRRRRFRRNPPSVLKNLPAFGLQALERAAGATAGKIVARKGRALLKVQQGGVMGMGVETLIGLGVGVGVSMLHHETGLNMAAGALQSTLEAGLSRLKLPFLGDALGADDYYLGFADAVDMAQAGQLAGYVDGPVRVIPAGVAMGEMGEMGDVGDSGFVASMDRYTAGIR